MVGAGRPGWCADLHAAPTGRHSLWRRAVAPGRDRGPLRLLATLLPVLDSLRGSPLVRRRVHHLAHANRRPPGGPIPSGRGVPEYPLGDTPKSWAQRAFALGPPRCRLITHPACSAPHPSSHGVLGRPRPIGRTTGKMIQPLNGRGDAGEPGSPAAAHAAGQSERDEPGAGSHVAARTPARFRQGVAALFRRGVHGGRSTGAQ